MKGNQPRTTDSPLPKPSSKPRGRGRTFLRLAGFTALGGVLVLLSLWAVAALCFDVRVRWLGAPLAGLYALTIVAAWTLLKRRIATVITLSGFALVTAWWLALQPSNDRDWQPDVAVLSYADIDGNRVMLHNIRNCEYRSEEDYDVKRYDKAFDLDKLRTADLFMVYWGSPHMAHTMVSFGFDDGSYVCFSIETRKEKGEGYSAVKGLFHQFELYYVVADERDVVRLRTNYREGEDVYLFRLNASAAQVREFFLDYVRSLNRLAQQPQWYNAAAHNCTTGIRLQRSVSARAPWDWRMLVNGHGDTLLYERGLIATNLPLAEVRQRALVNARARSAAPEADFSQVIRQGVPGIQP
jgi:uncharacterized protein DUF4105